MINPNSGTDAIVAALQSITTVVSELGNDSARIVGYEDAFPGVLTITEAINNLPNPSVLVVYNGTGIGDYKKGEVWAHRYSLILKTKNVYADLITAIINGVPVGALYHGLPFRRSTLLSSCDPIEDITSDRRQLFLSEYSSIDYWEMSFTLVERGLAA